MPELNGYAALAYYVADAAAKGNKWRRRMRL